VLGSLLLLVGVLVVVWFQSTYAGVFLTAFALVALLVLVLVRRVSANAWERSRESSGLLFGFLEERLAGTQDIRSSGAEAYTLRGFYGHARDRLWRISRARQMDAIPWSTNAVIQLGAQGLAFAVPAVLVQRGSISLGEAFALNFYAQLLIQPLDNVSHQVEALQQAIAGGRRVMTLLAMRSELVDGPGAELAPGALPVALRHVSFGYGDDPDVLHDVSIDLGDLAGKSAKLVLVDDSPTGHLDVDDVWLWER
jgi:ABC-type multidrug transport system fused ATPase/permease subunit